ncbi:MAG TPA: ATP-binding cassette domain-containing protein [Solirubrobacteraceae bacterium]|nr:ATP-binding cassette domain-containing protein [Solirubrobacteraceae bacterium]
MSAAATGEAGAAARGAQGEAPHGGPLVVARAISAGYGGAPALVGADFSVSRGDRIGVLGPNGGGKTTLFRVLLGELAPAAGALTMRTRCATVPQTDRSRLDFPVSALDVTLMGTLARLDWWRRPGRSERRRALAALDRVGLAAHDRSTFGELSSGQRQRVLIARALMADMDLLLLDEPYSGLDAPSAELITALIDDLAAEGRALMIATHDVEQARGWDQVLCLNRRQVAFGVPDQTLSRAVLEATYAGAIVDLPREGGGIGPGVLPPHHHDHGHGPE